MDIKINVNQPPFDADRVDTDEAAHRIAERLMLRDEYIDIPAADLFDAAWDALVAAGWPY